MGSSSSAPQAPDGSDAEGPLPPASDGLCPLAPNPLGCGGRHELRPGGPGSPSKAAAMYWGEPDSAAPGVMSTMFGATNLGATSMGGGAGAPPTQTVVPGSSGVKPANDMTSGPASSIMATLFGPTASQAMDTRAPMRSIGNNGSSVATMYSTAAGPQNGTRANMMMSTRNPQATTASFFGSRAPMYSAVGRGAEQADMSGNGSFGPPPMIPINTDSPQQEGVSFFGCCQGAQRTD
mmetsp:Transcript_123641/g.242587  ORF Transcript_123641/g.242587 Transcript_123641/m.242587 type:complete len:236 (-) Transcript_123641:25-732(-)